MEEKPTDYNNSRAKKRNSRHCAGTRFHGLDFDKIGPNLQFITNIVFMKIATWLFMRYWMISYTAHKIYKKFISVNDVLSLTCCQAAVVSL